MTRARDMANLGSQAGSGLDASDITTGTLGNTVQDNITRLGTVTAGSIGSAVTGFTGIKNVDTWRLHTPFPGNASPINENWERDDTYQQVLLGTGMTESSGVFSFPSTGLWNLYFATRSSLSGDSRYGDINIYLTIDNGSNWLQVGGATGSIAQAESGETYSAINCQSYVDITDTSTQKCRFEVGNSSGSVITKGDTGSNMTFVQFIRIGDT